MLDVESPMPSQEDMLRFERGYCPYCVIYDLKPRKDKNMQWMWCRCCNMQWRKVGKDAITWQQLQSNLGKPCKHILQRLKKI